MGGGGNDSKKEYGLQGQISNQSVSHHDDREGVGQGAEEAKADTPEGDCVDFPRIP